MPLIAVLGVFHALRRGEHGPWHDQDMPVDLRYDRALGALLGLAVGDAAGMPTQELPRRRAAQLVPDPPVLVAGPADNPISAGMPAGSITDDTEQALVIARLLVAGDGWVDPDLLAERLLEWERRMASHGSLDLLGPSTRRALAAVAAGADPTTTGASGATNGAAMRITPVGIATPPDPIERLVDAVLAADRPTHDTGLAHSGAAAVAAAVSWGIHGEDFRGVLTRAVEAARLAASHGHHAAGAHVARRIVWAVDLVSATAAHGGPDAALDVIDQLVGTSLATQEAVPAAFAVAALAPADPWLACGLAARLGGDSDTIAAMTGAVLGAVNGASALPPDVVGQVQRVNRLDLDPLVRDLLAIRDRREGSSS